MKEFDIYCPYCKREYNNKYLNFQCSCGKPLSISYHLDKKNNITFNKHINSIWRYRALLPIDIKLNNAVSLGEGITPVFREKYSDKKCFIKLESLNPSGSFKDRGTSLQGCCHSCIYHSASELSSCVDYWDRSHSMS